MEFSIKSGNPEKQRGACVVVGVFESRKLTSSADLIDSASQSLLSDLIRRGDMDGKAGATLLLHNVPGTVCDRVLLPALGKEKEFRDKAYSAAIRNTLKALRDTGAQNATIFLTEIPVAKRNTGWRIRQAAMLSLDSAYRFD